MFRRFGPTMRDLADGEPLGRAASASRCGGSSARWASSTPAWRAGRRTCPSWSTGANQALGAFASEDDALRETVTELPPTLRRASATLTALRPFAAELGPAARNLVPAMRALDDANAEVRPFAREAAPILRTQIRPFVREARPLMRDLSPAATSLAAAIPELRRSGRVLNQFVNLLGSNPGGREGPDKAGREEGYLFWLAWLGHLTANLINIDDGNGPMRPIFLTGTCGTLTAPRQRPPGRRVRARPVSAADDGVRQPPDHLAERAQGAVAARQAAEERAMNKIALSPARLIVIAGFALSCFGLLLFLWLAFGGPTPLQPKGYRVQIAFSDAATLAEQADVRSAGVSIGKVTGKELAPGGNKTLATIELEAKYVPLRSDARAVLRQKTLLGETYVELTPGHAEARGRSPRAAASRTARSPRPWSSTSCCAPSTRRRARAFQQWQQTSAQAVRGRARDLNDALGNLPVFAENAQGVVDVLQRRRDALRTLVRDTGTTFEAITRNEGALRTFITRNTEVFEAIAASRNQLAESIRVFPTFLRETRATLARLRTFSRQGHTAGARPEPVLEDAQPTLASLGRLAPDLERLFSALDPLIAAGRSGFPAMARVLRGLDPTLASCGPVPAADQPDPPVHRAQPGAALELHQRRSPRDRRQARRHGRARRATATSCRS